MRLVVRTVLSLAFALLLQVGRAEATIVTYVVALSGAQEVGGGDPDGTGTATLTLDTTLNTIDWNIVVANLDTVILDHIHQAPAGVNGGVVIDFGGLLSGTGLFDTDVSAVVANPTGFYVNVHTNVFPGGAVRGQIPEPATFAMLGAGLLGLAAASRRRAR
jgi:hypothetical protein